MSLITTVRHYGPLYATCLCFNRVVPSWLFRLRWYRIYERQLSEGRQPADRDVRWATPGDRDALGQIATGLNGEISNTERLCVCESAGQLIGCLGVSTHANRDAEIGCIYEIDESAVWLFQGVVARDHRGRNVFGRMLRFVSNQCLSDRRPRQQFAIARFNRPSERSNREAHIIGGGFCVRFVNFAWGWAWGDRVKNLRRITGNAARSPIHVRVS